MKTFLISFDFKDLLRTCSKKKEKETIIHRTTTKCIASLGEIFFAPSYSTTYAFPPLYAAFSFF